MWVVQKYRLIQFLPISVIGLIATLGGNLNINACYSRGCHRPVGVHWSAAQAIPPAAHGVNATKSRLITPRPVSAATLANGENITSTDPHLWQNGEVETLSPPNSTSVPQRPGRRPDEPLNVGAERRGLLPAHLNNRALGEEPAPPDPADEVAPAVIELPSNPRFLNPVLSHAMQQQLRNLIGRFESALLMANSLGSPTQLPLEGYGESLTAADKENPEAADSSAVLSSDSDLPPALVQAEELLNNWDTLIANGEHREAQERWLAARHDLWEQMPANRRYAQAEIRAVWLDRGTIVEARSAEGLTQLFDRLAAAGINTIFFETVNAGYPIYRSQVAPQQNPLIGPWDPLETAVDLAHQRGMTLHAWVWVFAAGNQRHNRLLNLPEDYLGPVITHNPEWAGYDNRGNPIPGGQDKPFLDPANPEVRSYLMRLMSEIVTEYAVDGLHLDYIRYPFQDPGANRTYGYGNVARWRFRSMTGVDPVDLDPRPNAALSRQQQSQQRMLWDRWTEFRIQQVNSFVETVSQTLKRQHPDLILSAAVFAKPEHERLQKIQQDWGSWARNGYIDWVVLMSYAEDTSRFEQLVTPWLVEEEVGTALVIPGIRILDLPRLAVMDQLQVTRDLPTPGYALFATVDLETDLTTYLEQTQGPTLSQPQSPIQIAFSRYQSLQREWYWLLSQDKLWMQQEQLAAWVAAANQLENDFQALTSDSSRRHFEAVEQGLLRVKTPLNGTILIETVNGSYRVKAWQHRLMAIERLLEYGERNEFSE